MKIIVTGASGFLGAYISDALWAGDLARLMPLLIETRPRGILHVGGPERMSRLDMGLRVCEILGLDSSLIKPLSRLDSSGPPRPRDLSLDISRLKQLFPNFAFTSFDEAVKSSYKNM